MVDVTVTIDGTTELARAFASLGGAIEDVADAALFTQMGQLVNEKMAGMGNYAPPPPNSKYIRTGRLGAGWALERQGKGSYAVTNAVPYRIYVVGNRDKAGQAWMHRGRWWLARQRLEDALPAVVAEVQKQVVDLMNKHIGGAS